MNDKKLLEAIGIIVRNHRAKLILFLKNNGYGVSSNSSDYELAYATIDAVKNNSSLLIPLFNIPLKNDWENADGDFDYKGLIASLTPLIVGTAGAIWGSGSTQQQAQQVVSQTPTGMTPPPQSQGLSTGAIVGISLGGLLIVGLVVYLVVKK